VDYFLYIQNYYETKIIIKNLQFAILVFVTTAFAENYYVSIAGDDSNTGTTLAAPFATIEKAAVSVAPGDSVFIRGGSYTSKISVANLNATESQPVTFQNYSGEIVNITPGGSDWSTALIIENSSYIFVKGLNFENCENYRHPVEIDNTINCKITGCVFTNTPYPPALDISSSTNLIVDNCVFTDTGNSSRDWDSHIVIGGSSTPYPCENIKIQNCEFTDSANKFTDHAVEMNRANNSEIVNCEFHGFENANVVTLGIPSWYFSTCEPFPYNMKVVSNHFYNNQNRCFKFQYCYESELQGNIFASNKCEIVNFGDENSYQNSIVENVFVDNFDLLSSGDAFVIMVQNSGVSNSIIGNEIYNSYIPETVSQNTPESIFVQNTGWLNIISNNIHDIRVKKDVDLTDYDPEWFFSAAEGGYAAFGMHILGSDIEITNVVINYNQVNYVRTGISVGGAYNCQMNFNTVHHCGTYGTRFKNGTRDSWMEGNEIYECGALHGGTSGIGLGFAGKNNVIYRNYIHHCHQGTVGKIGTNWWGDGNGMIADMDSDDTYFICNISANNDGRGLAITASENCRVYNNTFVNNGACPQIGPMPNLGTYSKTDEGYPATSNIIINNVFVGGKYAEVTFGEEVGQIVHHNLYFTNSHSDYFRAGKPIFWNDESIDYDNRWMTVDNWKTYSAANLPENAIGALWGNPEFFDEANANFRQLQSSIIVDAGTNWPNINSFKDFDNNIRKSNGMPDIGAFEFIPEPAMIFLILNFGFWIFGRKFKL
jgi:parallel beta-helix repeat protein